MDAIRQSRMNRDAMLARLANQHDPWDIVVIGGGATGAGVAVDAASRGYSVLLLEQSDFGKGTSSRSTKLVHGGVRYLAQGNVALVIDALRERAALRANAPHLVRPLPFVVPSYRWWETPFYGTGLKLYSLLAGRHGFGDSAILSRRAALARVPTLRTKDLRGGVTYFDGQFDDARLLVNLVQTATEYGAVVLNYVCVAGSTRSLGGIVDGVVALELESAREIRVAARVVINATGPFADDVRQFATADSRPLIAPSQGIHLVFDGSFLPGDSGIMVPKTPDGRVMFAVPWHGHTLVGTTDTPIREVSLEPRPLEQEVAFVLETAARYFERPPTREDVLSTFAGIRPLVGRGEMRNTAAISRDHTILVESSRLVTITGGKWTTYRHMAEDAVDKAVMAAGLPQKRCVTPTLRIHGWDVKPGGQNPLAMYGSDRTEIEDIVRQNTALGERLHPTLPSIGAEVLWAARAEMARTVEDVLARRCRTLFLNARAASAMAPQVATILARALGHDVEWERRQVAEFRLLAQEYLPTTSAGRGS
jgi:glycerol-3-phosphate dehydrogenase